MVCHGGLGERLDIVWNSGPGTRLDVVCHGGLGERLDVVWNSGPGTRLDVVGEDDMAISNECT